MRIAICWSNISGYMSACWRSLAQAPGVELKVWAYAPKSQGSEAPFDAQRLLPGIDCTLLNETQRSDGNELTRQLTDWRPALILVAGWMTPAYTAALRSPALASAHKVMGLDMPWLGIARQRLACVVKRPYVGQFDTLWVAGERARQYAGRLARGGASIQRGLYAYDADAFDPVAHARPETGDRWPRRFLYVGRYVEAKALDTLLSAYKRYREQCDDPWELQCCGTGPLAHLLDGQAGVVNHGFTQPADLSARYADSGAFILPSRYEPWGVVVAEAMGSGLPVIASEACGAAVELVHPLHTGHTFSTDDTEALVGAMRWIHDHPDKLPAMSRHCHHQAAAYSADRWRDRLLSLPRLGGHDRP